MNVMDSPAPAHAAPVLHYRDIVAASDWLCAAFGFEKHSVLTGESGAPQYAELNSGDAMIILIRDPGLDAPLAQSDAGQGGDTRSCYFVVDDADAHYARARAAGAEIVSEIGAMDHGGRGYSCRDDEGHIWSFGTYDPWHGRRVQDVPVRIVEGPPRARKRWALLSGLAGAVIASAVAAAWIKDAGQQRAPEVAISPQAAQTDEELARERGAREAAEQTAEEARNRALSEQNAKNLAERKVQQLAEKLVQEQQAREAAQHAADSASDELEKERLSKGGLDEHADALLKELAGERSAKDAALRAAADLREEVARGQSASEAAERASKEAQAALDRETKAREAAERAAEEATQRLAAEQSGKDAAERAGQEAREALDGERSAKAQALRSIAILRKQLAQAQGGQGESDTSEVAVPAPKPAQRPAKKGGQEDAPEKDPQYNGPLSPF